MQRLVLLSIINNTLNSFWDNLHFGTIVTCRDRQGLEGYLSWRIHLSCVHKNKDKFQLSK